MGQQESIMNLRKRGFRAMATGLLIAAGLALTPAAFAGGHVSVGVNLPGVSIGYGGHRGYVGVYAPAYGYAYGPAYYNSPVYYDYGPAYYDGYYGPSVAYYGPAYYGGYYYSGGHRYYRGSYRGGYRGGYSGGHSGGHSYHGGGSHYHH
jgi:hypothetical protein